MKLFNEKYLFFGVGIVGLLLLILITWFHWYSGKNLILTDTQEKLAHVANAAENQLRSRTYDELLVEGNLSFHPQEYQIAYLHKVLQPRAESISINGIGVAFYDSARNSIVAYAPSNQILQPVPSPLSVNHSSRSVLETKQPSFQLIDSPWRGRVYMLTVPLLQNTRIYGMVMVSVPEELVQVKIAQYATKHLILSAVIYGIWVSLLLLFYLLRKLKTGLPEQDQFQRLQSQTDLLLESMNEGVILLSEKGTITYMNRAFEEILSTDRAEWVGTPVFRSETEASLIENLQLVLSGRSSRVHSMPSQFLNRQMSHFSLDILALESSDTITRGALLIGKDISPEWEWRELSKRADLIHSLSQMAASMAHEVRNPLTSIKGFLQLLTEQQADPAKHRMYVQVMLEELERAHGIITEYLNLSRVNLAQQEKINLIRLLDDIRILMESEAVIRGINLHFYLMDAVIHCDPQKIKQVIINLVRNALEATPRGGFVTVATRPNFDSESVEISVTDTGEGIPQEALPQIFKPFFTTKKVGTGLGLPVCKQIIEEHQGKILVTSQEKMGSCFTILLPLPHTMDSNEPAPLPHPGVVS